MAEKQEWVYTEDGPELQDGSKKTSKTPRTVLAPVNKWYFITPWVVWVVTILYCFYLGGNWGAIGFLLIVFGPVPITIFNIWTYKKLALKPLKSKK